MDPEDISCPTCGSISPCGHSCPSNECNEDSTSCFDEVVMERKSHDKLDDISTNIARDDIDEFQDYSLDQADNEWDSSYLRSLKRDSLISAGNPPISTSIGKNVTVKNNEDFLEVTSALGDSYENAPEFLPYFDTDTLYSDESITVFSQDRNPLDGLQFAFLVADDFSVSDQRKDEISKTTDSCEKKAESSDADLAKAIPDLRIETFSEDYCGASDLNSLQENSQPQTTFECSSLDLPCHSHAGPSSSPDRGLSKSEPKKSPLKHSSEKKFICDVCGMSLSTKSSCKRHQLLHTGEKPFQCQDCGAKFALKHNFSVHYRTHSGERPFQCKVCGRTFATSSNLKAHFRKHTGEQPFVCIACGQRFTYQSALETHRRTHTR